MPPETPETPEPPNPPEAVPPLTAFFLALLDIAEKQGWPPFGPETAPPDTKEPPPEATEPPTDTEPPKAP